MKALIVYHSRTGNTKKVADAVAEGLRNKNLDVILKSVNEVRNQDFVDAKIIGLGSPTYFRTVSAELKKVIDDSIEVYGKLKGKKGFALATSGTKQDGEKCLNTLFEVLDCHGIKVIDKILVIGKPSKKDLERCIEFGKALVSKL
ncbi:MAG: flavodoxin family protein [Candidatus Thermoplasmatota archaeon]|nr:flavodoxin family protein [Candidatus Thermoplasmatota archaeon]